MGGQALAFWVAHFRINIKQGPRVYISADADFLGLAAHLERFAKAIGGKAVYAPKRGLTALYGSVEKGDDDRVVGIDVLHTLVGLDADAVRHRALAVTHPHDASLRFSVMDPLDCLVSRFENLRRLSEKQNEVGIWQANIALAVCRAYAEELIGTGNEAKAIKLATALFQLAGSATGLQLHAKYGLDMLAAIPVQSYASSGFRQEQAPRSIAAIARARENLAR